MEIKIDILSMHEINNAYEKAIEKYKEKLNGTYYFYNGKIFLKEIQFEDGHRGAFYLCIFEVTSS